MEPKTSTPAPLTNGTSDGGGAAARPAFRPGVQQKAKDRYWLHVLLFLITFATTAEAGGRLVGRFVEYQALIPDGIRFATALLGFLTVHEFGHYFAARRHHIATSLPYFIPLPFLGIGTFGAVIRIRERVPTTRKLFDIGAAGPLAGFVVALGILLYALATLPPPEYLLNLPGHTALRSYIAENGAFPDIMPPLSGDAFGLVVGNTPLYWALSQLFPNVPPMYEMMHYPVLLAGWFGLFFTALNLLPVGQLDGGHILYALVGRRWHRLLARGFVTVLLASGAIGFAEEVAPLLAEAAGLPEAAMWFVLAGILFFFLHRVFEGDQRLVAPVLLGLIVLAAASQVVGEALTQFGYSAWLFWSLLIVFLVKVEHPPVLRSEPLTPRRRLLGILSIVIFVLCFSLRPLYIV